MKSKLLVYPIMAFCLAVLSCSIPVPSPTITPDITTEPVDDQPGSGGLFPSGMVLAEGDGFVTFHFYNLDGSLMGTMAAPSLAYTRGRDVFPISGTNQGLPSLVYYTGRPPYHLLSNDGEGEDLVAAFSADISMTALTGVPAHPVLAYSTDEFMSGDFNTALYVGSTDTISTSQYLALNGDMIIPLQIETADGDPIGIWFSRMGLVGDALFEPTQGLYHLDLASMNVTEFAGGEDLTNVTLSPDATWVAYRDASTPGPFSLTIRLLSNGLSHTFPLLDGSDQGAGDGVISPANQRVAWMEGAGNYLLMYTPVGSASFSSTLRIGSMDGSTLIDYPSGSFDSTAGFDVVLIRPMGWLNDQTLIIQVSGTGESQSLVVLSVNLAGEINFIGNGSFICFLYP